MAKVSVSALACVQSIYSYPPLLNIWHVRICTQLVARDVNNSALYSTAALQVSVLEGAPSPPRFTSTNITLSVFENATRGSVIGSLAGLVVDGRGRTVNATFSFAGFINDSCATTSLI